jgi:hypothetical protein
MWFSHKFNRPGLRYELAVCIQTGEIVSVSGPFPPGQFTDSTIFQLGIMEELEEGEMVEADAGYEGPSLEGKLNCLFWTQYRTHD